MIDPDAGAEDGSKEGRSQLRPRPKASRWPKATIFKSDDSDTTVGVGPGGVTVGPRQRCRMETTTIEGDDGRRITRKERRCD